MVKEQQTERLGLRLTPSEIEMLERLTEVTGLSMSNVIRQAIRREYSDRFGALPSAKPKPKTKRK